MTLRWKIRRFLRLPFDSRDVAMIGRFMVEGMKQGIEESTNE